VLVAKYQIYKSRGGPWIFLVPPLFRRPWLELFERNIIKDEINVWSAAVSAQEEGNIFLIMMKCNLYQLKKKVKFFNYDDEMKWKYF